MYAILKDGNGAPVALFEIERETSKRVYGKIVDTLGEKRFFYLNGLTKCDRSFCDPKPDYAKKEIVMCILGSENPWLQMKPQLQRTHADYLSRNKLIQSEDCRRRTRTREQEQDNRKRAMFEALEEIAKYVSKSDMLSV